MRVPSKARSRTSFVVRHDKFYAHTVYGIWCSYQVCASGACYAYTQATLNELVTFYYRYTEPMRYVDLQTWFSAQELTPRPPFWQHYLGESYNFGWRPALIDKMTGSQYDAYNLSH